MEQYMIPLVCYTIIKDFQNRENTKSSWHTVGGDHARAMMNSSLASSGCMVHTLQMVFHHLCQCCVLLQHFGCDHSWLRKKMVRRFKHSPCIIILPAGHPVELYIWHNGKSCGKKHAHPQQMTSVHIRGFVKNSITRLTPFQQQTREISSKSGT